MGADFDAWWKDHQVVGRLAGDLLTDSSWIERRVETVAFVNNHTIERRVTLDISRTALRDRVGAGGPTLLRVPLGVFRKALLLDFDLRAADGSCLDVVPSRIDADLAAASMVDAIADPVAGVSAYPDWYHKQLVRIAREFPGSKDVALLSDPTATGDGVALWTPPDDYLPASEVESWRALVAANDKLWSLMVNFSLNFMLMTVIDLRSDGVCVIKLRYREEMTESHPSFGERVGFVGSYLSVIVSAPGIGTGRSQHFQLTAPEGMSWAGASLLESSSELRDSARPLPRPASQREYQRRLSPGRASVYTSHTEKSSHYVVAALRPNPRLFLVPASFSVLASSLLLFAGAILETCGHRITQAKGSSAEAAIVLLLAIPTLASAYLATTGEHEMLSDVTRAPRFVTALAALAVIAAAGSLAVEPSTTVLQVFWYVVASSCAAVFLCFRFLIFVIRRSNARIEGISKETRTLPISPFEPA